MSSNLTASANKNKHLAQFDAVQSKENVGALPTDSTEQNSKWYKLYKQVPNEPEVQEAHKLFLMYRDMAVLSLPLVALVPLSLNVAGVSNSTLALAAGLFVVQYLLTALSARWSGIRFVQRSGHPFRTQGHGSKGNHAQAARRIAAATGHAAPRQYP